MRTFIPKKGDIEKKWWLVNAEGKILGRLATEVADLLRGKKKPQFAAIWTPATSSSSSTPRRSKVTGRKLDQKDLLLPLRSIPGGSKPRPEGPP